VNTGYLQSDKLNIINWITEIEDASLVEQIKAIMQSEHKFYSLSNESEDDFTLSVKIQTILDNRLAEDKTDYIEASDSINKFKAKYCI